MSKSIIAALAILLVGCTESFTPDEKKDSFPSIYPDYTEVTVPSTIAPLNFRSTDDCSMINAVVKVGGEEKLRVQNEGYINFPETEWSELLEENKGGNIEITVSVKKGEKWTEYKPFNIYISNEPIDYGLVYRLVAPGYEIYSKMGIYQRSLSDFTETALYENTLLPSSCVNCHSFCNQSPDKMSLHLRGQSGGTFLSVDGKTELLNTATDNTISSFVYPYWHPSGKYIAYSVNNTQQVFHSNKDERIEVLDLASDIIVYDVEKNEAFSSPLLKSDSVFETFPSFSPDGKSLYFCSATFKKMPSEYKEVKYNLCRIGFDADNGGFSSSVDTLVSAEKMGKSVSFPRPSPDGRYLMFTLSDYGNFSIWHREADLWLLDLQTGEFSNMEKVNSPNVESYHSWSSNGRWFVFSSRRDDGLYTRPYIAAFNPDGTTGKPFMLPQENPEHNDLRMYSYNIPEFVTSPVSFDNHSLENKSVKKQQKKVGYRK